MTASSDKNLCVSYIDANKSFGGLPSNGGRRLRRRRKGKRGDTSTPILILPTPRPNLKGSLPPSQSRLSSRRRARSRRRPKSLLHPIPPMLRKRKLPRPRKRLKRPLLSHPPRRRSPNANLRRPPRSRNRNRRRNRRRSNRVSLKRRLPRHPLLRRRRQKK